MNKQNFRTFTWISFSDRLLRESGKSRVPTSGQAFLRSSLSLDETIKADGTFFASLREWLTPKLGLREDRRFVCRRQNVEDDDSDSDVNNDDDNDDDKDVNIDDDGVGRRSKVMDGWLIAFYFDRQRVFFEVSVSRRRLQCQIMLNDSRLIKRWKMLWWNFDLWNISSNYSYFSQ